ncbi:MAG: aminoacyl-histidine dipeptidase [Eubacterium sp.]|nr:aminoacyl-histidine dipeptidase [Eubacterium sp.]
MGILTNLEPKPVFQYFEEICGIPHGSSNTKEISDYLVAFAKKHDLRVIRDDKNNVIIWKEGTAGYEETAPVMLQGHMDMVCEKEEGFEIDFAKEGVRLQLQDGVITAQGTTLGGDDGIAVAYMLAILSSTDIPHPPLEAVFTVDEEIGMLGTAALDASVLKARTMLNIDSEEEGYLLVSCAGGVAATVHLPIQREKTEGIPVTLTVTGLQGGHSGVEIDKGRGNANQILGRILYELEKTFSFRICEVSGGLKDNAIPRQAEAKLLFASSDQDRIVEFKNAVKELAQILAKEYRQTDPEVGLAVDPGDGVHTIPVMTADTAEKVVAALVCLPGGIQRMSADVEGLVQTSLNLGILKTEEDEVSFSFAVRSSVETEKKELVNRISCLVTALGGTVSCSGEYPAWEYRQNSPLRDRMVEVFEEQYGRKPVVQAIHAGVECGLFAGKLPGLDCVSFGPDMKDIHTPKESMDVESVRRTWDYTLEVLKRLR